MLDDPVIQRFVNLSGKEKRKKRKSRKRSPKRDESTEKSAFLMQY